MKLKCLRDYRCSGLRARPGDVLEVGKVISPEKAEQLLRDFPSRWEAVDSRDNPKAPSVSLGDKDKLTGALWKPAKEKGKAICLVCGQTFSERGIRGHITRMHPEEGYK